MLTLRFPKTWLSLFLLPLLTMFAQTTVVVKTGGIWHLPGRKPVALPLTRKDVGPDAK